MSLSSGWNLPPGVSERDLPGNSREDEQYDRFMETQTEGMSDEEAEEAFRDYLRDLERDTFGDD